LDCRERRREDVRDDRLASGLDDQCAGRDGRGDQLSKSDHVEHLEHLQRAAVAALTGDLLAVEEMREAFDRRRKIMASMLNAIDGVHCALPDGAFYCFPDVSGLLGRPLGGRVATSSSELAEVLLETIQIAVVPGEAFGAPGFFRLSYALGDDDLVEGLERLAALVVTG